MRYAVTGLISSLVFLVCTIELGEPGNKGYGSSTALDVDSYALINRS